MAINTSTLRKKQHRRRLQKLALIADKIDDVGSLRDKQDEMLHGLDDGWQGIRNAIVEFSAKDGEWAGYPLPIEHAKLVIEPRHPLYKTLNGACLKKEQEPHVPHEKDDQIVVNQWQDHRGWTVFVVRDANGKSSAVVFPRNPATSRAKMTFDTLAASQAWSAEAEFTAMARLKTLVTVAAFRYYLLTGTFLETSKRSGVVYLFRKLRPTLAFVATRDDDMKLLTALCLHPIGYYQGTFAGSMVPTDDLIAHLTMMRGDEHYFWKKCNQHDPEMPEAGI